MRLPRPPRRVALVGVAFLLAACGLVARLGYPQRDAIKVPHERHIKAELECTSCHETIYDSTSLATKDLPKEKKCMECHREDKEEKHNCAMCHTQPDKPQPIVDRVRILKMNHQTHIERVKEDCRVCHQDLPNPLRTDDMSPKMDACLGCHEHQEHYDQGKCDECHEDLTKYPLKPISNYTHGPDWLHKHRLDARSSTQACGTCHEQTFCADCHAAATSPLQPDKFFSERIDRQFIHRNDFIGRHPIEARADQALCLRCHGTSFCQSCHVKEGLVPGGSGTLNPHPPNFGNGALHGPAARRDIVTCAACHEQGAASICVTCHRVGGVGGNPHPASWLLRHSKSEVGNNAMCQTCHAL